MSERTLVPIFFFWALLTIITPTLILLSEKSKADLDLNGNITEGMKARRMIGYAQNDIIRTTPPVAKSLVADQEELASAPAPAPAPEECSDLADLINLNGYITEGMKARGIIGYAQNDIIRTPPQLAKSLVEELASAPAPVPRIPS